MLQITPQMRVLVAIEPIDGRKGIDSLACLCKHQLMEDPFSGCVFIFRTRSREAIKVLVFDGQGFWLAQKRLSKGRFRWWPESNEQAACSMQPHQVQILFAAGDASVRTAPTWRPVQRVSA